MDSSFHSSNRKTLYDAMPDNTLVVSFAGDALRLSADAYNYFYPNRNFVYLTGISGAEAQGFIFFAHKVKGKTEEIIFALPKDLMAERWNGRRLSFEEISQMSGIPTIKPVEEFENVLHTAITNKEFAYIALDLDRYKPDEPDGEVHRFAKLIGQRYPHLCIVNYHGQLRTQRTIKQPCEIFAMKKAMQATKAGIFAMMKASKPEVYEYELLAEFNYACTKMGILTPVHYPIIAAGENNFCIHYYGYQGQAKDGDMILVDCGAYQDNIWTDVSRTWPVNGQFNERQRQLYECAYKTSEYMFGIIKPGMPMADVDLTIRKHCYEYLRELKLVDTYENVGKLMWHGGAHHVGYDVHDEVDVPGDRLLEAGMIFCVDVGIYCEDWGIGFRLEDNCLVTEDGCINLSAAIPRSIEEIEAVFHNV